MSTEEQVIQVREHSSPSDDISSLLTRGVGGKDAIDLHHPHTVLIDGTPLAYRAFHATPPLTRSDGVPTNAVFTYARILLKLQKEVESDFIAVFLDSGAPSFRRFISDQYKANRPEVPSELVRQFPLIREAVTAFGIGCIELDGFEADDLLATYARLAAEKGHQVTIVSPDKDVLQLVRPNVTVFDPIKRKTFGRAEVLERYGVEPSGFAHFQALMGDPTDNVPGVPGIGHKTASDLISRFGSVEGILEHLEEIKGQARRKITEHAQSLQQSLELVTLRDDLKPPVSLETLRRIPTNPQHLLQFLERHEFQSIITQIQREEKRLDTKPLPTGDYHLITSIEELDQWIDEAYRSKIVGIATYISSERWHDAACEMVGISLSTSRNRACYIPLRAGTQEDSDLPLVPCAETLRRLKQLFEDPRVIKVAHDVKHHMKNLHLHGISLNGFDDVMVLSYALDCGKMGHDLATMAKELLRESKMDLKQAIGVGKKAVPFHKAPTEATLAFASQEADFVGRLFRLLQPRLIPENLDLLYMNIEKPLIPVLADMEITGIQADPSALRQISEELEVRLQEITKEAFALAGGPFNMNSVKELGEVLFEKERLLGDRLPKKSQKSGFYSTSSAVLENLAEQGHRLPELILEQRGISKLQSTYAKGLLNEISGSDHRVHTTFRNAETVSGRLSSVEPNLQNIPVRTADGRRIRRAFLARPNCVLLCADYSQVELRILAEMAHIEELKNAFLHNADVHSLTASQVFRMPVENVTKELRRRAKMINFGIIYGMSQYVGVFLVLGLGLLDVTRGHDRYGLSRQLSVPVDEARQYISQYFRQYPGIQRYMEMTKQQCRERGYVTTMYGRRCWIQDINSSNFSRRGFAERTAINTPIQGTSADITKMAMNRVFYQLNREGYTTKMILQVHDELVFEVPQEELETVTPVIQHTMEGVVGEGRFSIPLPVDTKCSVRWSEDEVATKEKSRFSLQEEAPLPQK